MLKFASPADLAAAFPYLRKRAAVSRRGFLKVTALGGAGFVIGCGQAPQNGGAGSGAVAPDISDFNAFVRVGSDDTVTVILKHLDFGQGVTTGLTTIVAEEMDARWEQMRWEFAPADAATYQNFGMGIQATGGSSSIANSWDQLRKAGAAARAMLAAAAAEAWEAPVEEISVAGGVISHPSGRSGGFGAFAARAAQMTPPAEPALKDPSAYALIGRPLPRIDSPEKTDGTAVYTIDVTRPGMLTAAVARPPKFGATVASFDDAAARAVAGVQDVVQIPTGVAVLADSYWAASQGRDALSVEWDFANAETRGSGQIMADLKQAAQSAGPAARNEGDVEAAFADAAKVVEQSYEFPYLNHAQMEPLNLVLEMREDGGCEIWNGSQTQTLDQAFVGAVLGLDPSQVKVNTLYAGGSFGRRAVPMPDYLGEAASILKAIDGRAPVKMQWSREDDLKAGRYRPMSYHILRAALNEAGEITAWTHRMALSSSSVAGSPMEEMMIVDGVDESAVEGAKQLPYAIPSVSVEAHVTPVGVPTLWWRSVGHIHNAYVVETFLDQVAAAAEKDPVALRRALLADHPRHLGVLDKVAEMAGPAPEGAGKGRGVAVHESFNSFVAEIADVTVAEDGSYTVDKVYCAVDCGLAVNPDVVKAQMEGGIGFGLGAAMREKITLTDGTVDQSNFYDYFPLRMEDMPEVEVAVIPSAEAPTGVGEPGTPPIGPAVANALRAATGKPVTKLPIGDRVAV